MNHEIGILVKYHGPTDYRGSRFSMTLPRFDNKRLYAEWDHKYNGLDSQVEAFLSANDIECVTLVDIGKDYVVTVEFNTQSADNLFKLFGVE